MINLKHSIFFFVLIMSPFLNSYSQELVLPLENNPVLQKWSEKNNTRAYRSSDTFDLSKYPFWDDFSGDSPYPKDSLWSDNYVFVNSSMAYHPIGSNCATFDGLNELGNPYSPGIVNSKGSIADKLTSVPINLKGYKLGDSIYLSFYYQPMGLGDAPENYDSLVLEFKPDRLWAGTFWDSNAWVRVWSVKGSGLKPFKQIVIPVNPYLIDTSQVVDTIARFYYNGFKFRFANYGSLSGNMDHWHLCYVYLDKGRSRTDAYYKDMAVTEKPISLLKAYTSMPYDHFINNKTLLRYQVKIKATNLWDKPLNLFGNCSIYDMDDNDLLLSSGDNKTIYNRDTSLTLVFDLQDSLKLTNITFKDTVLLNVVLKSTIIDDRKPNDMVSSIQGFYNYYAYDDGTPEMGYGVYPGKSVKVAYKFTIPDNLPHGDSLRGVHMYFNLSEENNSNAAFKILVWNNGDNTSKPIEFLSRIPGIDYDLGNGYYFFNFDTAIGVNKTFWIGWEQSSEYFMNIGLDMNYFELLEDSLPTRDNSNVRFFANNRWDSSSVKGALMIRPVITDKPIVSVKENNQLTEKRLIIFPNPSNSFININGMKEEQYHVKIMDMGGKIIYSEDKILPGVVDLNDLSKGFYIINVTDQKGTFNRFEKIIINK